MYKELIFNWVGTLPYGNVLQNKFVFAGLILITFVILAIIVLNVYKKFLEKWTKKTKTEVDDVIVERTKKPLFYLILAYGLEQSILHLGFNGVVSKFIDSLMALVFVLIITRVIDILIDSWGIAFAKKTKSTIDDVILPLFHKATRVIFVIIAIMWVLSIWQIDIGPYLAGAGIAGVVLGFALQDSLKNVFGGITLLLDKTFKVGDKVKIESGEIGTIHDIGLRSTKLITYDNEVIYVPNGYLANSRIQNYTHPSPKLRVNVEFSVEYGSDPKKVQKVVLDVIKKIDGVMEDPEPVADFYEMGDFALKFKAKFWVDRWDKAYAKKLEATEKIYNVLNDNKIGIPFPTQTIHLKK